MPGVRDQADDEVVLGDLGVEGRVVASIECDGGGALDAVGELLGRLEGAAGCGGLSAGHLGESVSGSTGGKRTDGDGDARRGEVIQGRLGDHAGAEEQNTGRQAL